LPAEPYEAIAAVESFAFLAAPPSARARQVLRWILRRGMRAAVMLPFWRDACWWPLVAVAADSFVISASSVLGAAPVGVYLFWPSNFLPSVQVPST
jgi:hypothetical protein